MTPDPQFLDTILDNAVPVELVSAGTVEVIQGRATGSEQVLPLVAWPQQSSPEEIKFARQDGDRIGEWLTFRGAFDPLVKSGASLRYRGRDYQIRKLWRVPVAEPVFYIAVGYWSEA